MRLWIWRRWLMVGITAVVVTGVLTTATIPVPGRAAADGQPDRDERCNYDSPVSLEQTAEDLLHDRYHLGQHPPVTLRHDLTWTEDPLGDRQWRQKFQQLRFVMALMYRWQDTHEARYRDRAFELVRSWIAANPRVAAASDSAWKDQVTAWRAMTLVCIAGMVSPKSWLDDAIRLHGAVLADPRFYVVTGNHALNQSLGLLDVGCYLGRTDWEQIASRRIDRFITRAIDTQGVSDEQATKYDRYDYERFMLLRDHMLACGLPAPSGFERVERIPDFLAQATRPDGHYETIGDSDDRSWAAIRGTPEEYTASLGTRGTPPAESIATFRRGYAFGRTGWGADGRAFTDETFFSLRFGHGLQHHGHDDGGALTVFGRGAQLLVDPGYGDQNSSKWHRYFVSRAAHDAVVVDGLRSVPSRANVLRRSVLTDRSADLVVQVRVYPGVTMRRRVMFSRKLGYMVVEDTMSAGSAQTYRQLWHLTEDAHPLTQGRRTWTRRPTGNLLIQQLGAGVETRTLRGTTDPIQGWISRSYGQRAPAPVIEQRLSGRQVRFLTLLAPFGDGTGTDRPPVHVSGVALTPHGFSMTVAIDGTREVIRATEHSLAIADVPTTVTAPPRWWGTP
jgi:Heparinase II/III-like protein/Heparinase II/III N-terminus